MIIDKLSIGVIMDSTRIYTWQFSTLQKIVEDNGSVDIIIVDEKYELRNNKSSYLSKDRLKRFECKVVSAMSRIPLLRSEIGKFNDALFLRDLNVILPNTRILRMNSDRINLNESGPLLQELIRKPIDLIIDFRIGKGENNVNISRYAQYGLWKFEHGINISNPSIYGGIFEALSGTSETWIRLKLHYGKTSDSIDVHKESISTHQLPACNTNNLLWASVFVINNQLRQLRLLGFEEYIARAKKKNTNGSLDNNIVYRRMHFISRLYIRNYLKYIWKCLSDRMFYYQWSIVLMRKNVIGGFNNGNNAIQLIPKTDRFWADPFIIYHKDLVYIFIEEEIRKSKKGHISVLKVDSLGKVVESRQVINENYHMSYPFIFKLESKMYMIPESSQDKAIKLYCCDEFPYQWSFVRTIMREIRAVDTCVFYYEGRWWLFCSKFSSDGDQNRFLYLYHSKDLFSDEWLPHPLNPVICNIKGSRNAGKIFEYNGELYRPAQDCSRRYGYGIRVNKIIKLNEEEYEEEEVDFFNSDMMEKVYGIHTINMDNQYTVIDVLRRLPKLSTRSRYSRLKPSDLEKLKSAMKV